MPIKTHALLADRVLLPRWQRWSTYATFALLVCTGVLWWTLDVDRGENPASAAQVWLLRLHGAAAMFVLICFGALLPAHIRIAWALHRNRVLGGTLFAVVALLTLTGYGLYYSVGDTMRALSSWIHFCVGVAAPALLVLHIYRGRAARRSRAAQPQHATHVTHVAHVAVDDRLPALNAEIKT